LRQLYIKYTLAGLVLLVCSGCGAGSGAALATAVPSPAVAVAQPVEPSPTPPPAFADSGATGVPATAIGQPAPATGATADQPLYLWPAYIPPGMLPSLAESHVASEGQIGPNGQGFYVVTLNDRAKKLSIGGGDLGEALPLAGDERSITVGGRTGRLITSGNQREIIFDVPSGILFVYSSELSEEELLKVAASLRPIELQALRDLASVR
jgi:hypothetical protein